MTPNKKEAKPFYKIPYKKIFVIEYPKFGVASSWCQQHHCRKRSQVRSNLTRAWIRFLALINVCYSGRCCSGCCRGGSSGTCRSGGSGTCCCCCRGCRYAILLLEILIVFLDQLYLLFLRKKNFKSRRKF